MPQRCDLIESSWDLRAFQAARILVLRFLRLMPPKTRVKFIKVTCGRWCHCNKWLSQEDPASVKLQKYLPLIQSMTSFSMSTLMRITETAASLWSFRCARHSGSQMPFAWMWRRHRLVVPVVFSDFMVPSWVISKSTAARWGWFQGIVIRYRADRSIVEAREQNSKMGTGLGNKDFSCPGLLFP